MMYLSIELSDGSEWACLATERGSQYGEGVFVRRADGTWAQQIGTGQTPVFGSPRSFSRYIHDHYRDLDGNRLPRMVSSRWN